MFSQRKLKFKTSILIIVTLFLMNLFSALPAFALNGGSGNKSANFLGYRYIDSHNIQVWIDKSPSSLYFNPSQLKVIEGTDINGRQLQIQKAVIGTGYNTSAGKNLGITTGFTSFSKGGSYLITTASSDAFSPGKVYSVVLSSTLKSNNGMILGNYNFHQDIISSFVAPDAPGTPDNSTGTYAGTAPGLVTSFPANNSVNVALEGSIWFSVNVPVQNYGQVLSGLVLKKNGVPLTYDITVNTDTTKDGDIYYPVVTDDQTFFYFPMTASGSNTSYNLDPGATYELSIPAMTLINGQTIAAQTITFTTTPDITPTKISSAPTATVNGNQVNVSWPASTAVTGISPAATGYNVYVSQDPYWNFAKVNTTLVTDTTYTVSGLNPATTYYFRVAPVNGVSEGGFSDLASATIADTTAPSWPNGSTLTASNITSDGMTLSWPSATDNVGVTGYKIYKDGQLLDSVNGSTTSYNVTGLSPDTQYTFKVDATDAAGLLSNNGPQVNAKTAIAPVSPTPTPAPVPTPSTPAPVAQPAPVPTEPKKVYAGQLIRSGVSGQSVTTVQDKLKSLGIDCGASDGIFGPKTLSAVKRFQAANGLVADGIVGQLTWCKLFGFNVGSYARIITYGNTTPTIVGGIQDKLISLGFNPGSLDGKFGPRTLAAIKAFQKAHGLIVDGIVGPQTWRALFG